MMIDAHMQKHTLEEHERKTHVHPAVRRTHPMRRTSCVLSSTFCARNTTPQVLQCIEEAHFLEGHTADLVGDGTPKLPWKAYRDALDAIAKCASVGRHRGTRARY